MIPNPYGQGVTMTQICLLNGSPFKMRSLPLSGFLSLFLSLSDLLPPISLCFFAFSSFRIFFSTMWWLRRSDSCDSARRSPEALHDGGTEVLWMEFNCHRLDSGRRCGSGRRHGSWISSVMWCLRHSAEGLQ